MADWSRRCRLAYARILLFRPMLARFCLPPSQVECAPTPVDQDLRARILRDGAKLCVENAQNLITLLYESCGSNEGIGILPWWYRVYYLIIASQHLIASMLRPEIFASLAVEFWSKAMSALCAHEHLSPSVKRCIAAFQKTWQKVTDLGHLGSDQCLPPAGISTAWFQDVFQHIGFEAENPFLGIESPAWLDDFEWNL